MDYKVIMSGRLEFGTDRNYQQVVKLYEHRRENYFRADVLFRAEQLFNDELMLLEVPRFIGTTTDKVWRNTISLLEQVADYAIAGDFNLWLLQEGTAPEHWLIEPKGDKTAVRAYLEGRQLTQETGREEDAHKALSQAIEKFARHALAYERRGAVNLRLKNYEDALYDYNKSIHINPNKPEAYHGRGLIAAMREDWKAAIADMELAMAKSIPHQVIFWRACLAKADYMVQTGQLAEAAKAYKMILVRDFPTGHPFLAMRRRVAFAYGKALAAAGQPKEALAAFNQAWQAPAMEGGPQEAEILLHRGLAAQQVGQRDFVDDWRQAADRGSDRAAQLLAQLH